MKHVILFLALLCGALADEAPKGAVESEPKLTFSVGAESATITAKYLVVMASGSEPILRIGELPYERVVNTRPGVLTMIPYRYLRPEKPDEVKVELWTADGRKWVAKWEEVKE